MYYRSAPAFYFAELPSKVSPILNSLFFSALLDRAISSS